MASFFGEGFAIFSAFCYAFGSVAISKNTLANDDRGNAVLLSVIITAILSGGLWLILGPPFPAVDLALWRGVAFFVLAGVLATVLGRLFFFRSVELAGAIETGLLRRLIPVFATSLALLILGETISIVTSIGFLLIFVAIAIAFATGPRQLQKSAVPGIANAGNARPKGRLFSIISAASYGGSFVARKIAMRTLPDPLIGALIGAVTAIVWFSLVAIISGNFLLQIRDVLQKPTRWQLLAALAISAGQTSQFFALMFTTVTNVAIIGSLEMFIAAWLAAYILKTEMHPGKGFVIASAIAMTGIIVISSA